MSDDLIRRSDAIKAVNKAKAEGMTECPTYYLGIVPTIEPKRGEWIETEYTGRIYGIYRCQYKCSCCEYVPMYRGEPIVPTTGTLLFCPNCGADMREESER